PPKSSPAQNSGIAGAKDFRQPIAHPTAIESRDRARIDVMVSFGLHWGRACARSPKSKQAMGGELPEAALILSSRHGSLPQRGRRPGSSRLVHDRKVR